VIMGGTSLKEFALSSGIAGVFVIGGDIRWEVMANDPQAQFLINGWLPVKTAAQDRV